MSTERQLIGRLSWLLDSETMDRELRASMIKEARQALFDLWEKGTVYFVFDPVSKSLVPFHPQMQTEQKAWPYKG